MPKTEQARSRVAGLALVIAAAAFGCSGSQKAQSAGDQAVVTPLTRRYVEGQATRYVMIGSNQGRERTINYSAEAEARVTRDEQGRFIEEVRWTKLTFAGREIPLDQASGDFRQYVSLDPGVDMTPPDITGINPMLIGPVFDFMTFYVDLHPSLHQGRLRHPGDHVHVAHSQPNSWADGTQVILGEDCIDFDLSLKSADDAAATLHVRHVPPAESSINLPAPWMRERVNAAYPNNWVQVQRAGAEDGFVAAAGHETFDVVITIDPADGSMVAAAMDNPVDVMQRRCADESLAQCGEPVKYRIRRQIELRRIP